jgi:MFS family permease
LFFALRKERREVSENAFVYVRSNHIEQRSRFVELLGKAVIGVLAVVLAAIVQGFTLSVLWNWFLVGIGLPPIGIAQALGITATIGYLRAEFKAQDEASGKSLGFVGALFSTVIAGAFGALLFLVYGWLLLQFM